MPTVNPGCTSILACLTSALALSLLASCGGGGGSSAPGSQAMLEVSPGHISVTAGTVDAAPTAAVTATIISSASAATQYYLEGKFTSNGIASIGDPNSNGDLLVQFKDPSTLGPGTYNDTITIEACVDQACNTQISDSPQQVAVQYVVALSVPAISLLRPSFALVGGSSFTFDVIGQNFASDATIQWNGTALPTTYVSSSELVGTVPASDLTAVAEPAITVANGSTVSAPADFFVYTVTPPSLNTISPGSAYVGASSFTLTVTGEFFTPTSAVQWAGAPLTTTFVNGSELTAVVPNSDLQSVGNYAVNVVIDGEASSAAQFSVQAIPTPAITQLNPDEVTADAPGFVLSVVGSGFAQQSVVNWNGSARPTTYGSGSGLTAQIPASDLATAATVSVTVSTGNLLSNVSYFAVQPLPALALSSVTPATVTAGGTAFVLSVYGSGFTASSQVLWAGSARSTTYVNAGFLSAQILASDLASAGSAPISVQNPAAEGGTQSGLSVAINKASVDAVAFQINPAHSGAISFKSASLPASSLWSVNLGGQPSYALIAGGLVYVTVTPASANGTSELYALNQTTGATVWGPVEFSGAASAAYENGTVFVISGEDTLQGQMHAVDGSSGAVLWSSPLMGQSSFSSGITALNGVAYTNGQGVGATMYALDESTGAQVWSAPLDGGGDATPAVTVDGLYVVFPCQLYDFDPPSGRSIWHTDTGCDGGGGATAVVANGLLYASSLAGTGFSGATVNAETGAPVSTYVADNPPALGATAGYFLQGGTLRAVQTSNNAVLWSFAGDGQLVSCPLLVNSYVFIGSATGNLYALDATTGTLVWQVNVGAAIPPGPGINGPLPLNGLSAGDGLLVVPAGNTLTAYQLSSNP